jgi:hypothetical protein
MSIRRLMSLIGCCAIVLFLLMLSWDLIIDALLNHHVNAELTGLEMARICDEEATRAGSLASRGVPVASSDGFPVLSPGAWILREARLKARAVAFRTEASYHSGQVKVYATMKRWVVRRESK